MKNLLLVLSLVITASPAFASRARLESLGENANGSYYINDGRNIFLNPAAINGYKKKLFIELGVPGSTADVSAPTSGAVSSTNFQANDGSKVQGGFTNTFGDFVYGVYVGRESTRALNAVAGVNGAPFSAGLTAPDHALDFFFGGESGLKWGADVFYAGALNQGASKATASMFGVKLGVDVNNLAVFTTVGISNNAKLDTGAAATTNELKGKISVDVGATYTMDDITYLAKFATFGSDYTPGTGTGGGVVATSSTMAFGLGAGWKKEASKSVTMFTRLQLDYQQDKVESTNASFAAAVGSQKYYNVPLILGAEAQATSWLTIRGSISHSLLGQAQTAGSTKTSLNNITTAAAGLGFNFGDLTVDALVGQSAAVASGAGSESSMNGVNAGSRFGFGDNMVSRLSMTYNF